MAEVNAKDLTTKTSPASTDSMLLFGTTSNEGAKITVDNLADNILSRLSTKTFANQVGGSSAATLLSQLSTLNSNLPHASSASFGGLIVIKWGRLGVVRSIYGLEFGEDGKTFATITDDAYKPASEVRVTAKVYNGSNYVDCRLGIDTNGVCTLTDFFGGAIAGAQLRFFSEIPILFYINT